MKIKKSPSLPSTFKSYFWDVKFDDLDLKKNPEFILKRIIDRGNTQALRWAQNYFSQNDIKKLILSSRDLSRKTANFWSIILNINPNQVPCMQKRYSRIPFGPSN